MTKKDIKDFKFMDEDRYKRFFHGSWSDFRHEIDKKEEQKQIKNEEKTKD